MTWRDAALYAFDPPLTREEWAWQFLRRNPEYRRDYAWFIATWQQLEAEYGVPPKRDFFRWKQDPRAWRAEAEFAGCGTEVCPGENDQVLIECWLGAKWGLRKFPIDPAVTRPAPGIELDWREQPVVVAKLEPGDELSPSPVKMALEFDLELPLAAQLDQARIRLVARRRALEQAGRLPWRAVRAAAATWGRWLRLLDGVEVGAGMDELQSLLDLADPAGESSQARQMTVSGYRRILLMD